MSEGTVVERIATVETKIEDAFRRIDDAVERIEKLAGLLTQIRLDWASGRVKLAMLVGGVVWVMSTSGTLLAAYMFAKFFEG